MPSATILAMGTVRVAVDTYEPGWRNWQTQRTQNPRIASPWGFDPPSRHHLRYQYPLWNHRLAALVRALCLGCFPVDSALRYEFRYSAHPLYFNMLAPLAAEFISADYPYLRQITECAADLVRSSPRYGKSLHCMFFKSDGSLPKFPFSGMGRGRKYEMKIRTSAESLLSSLQLPMRVRRTEDGIGILDVAVE